MEIVARVRRGHPLFVLGVVLVAFSYVLLAPTFLFLSLSLSGKARFWFRLAGITYILNWVLFISGLLLAGTEAARSVRRWIVGRIRGRR